MISARDDGLPDRTVLWVDPGAAGPAAVSGLSFAYCDFTRPGGRTTVAHSIHRTRTAQPLGLRPSLAADNN